MNVRRYRLVLTVGAQLITREITLESDQPTHDIHYWLEDEYDFRANLKKVYWLRDDGVEEQID